MTGCIGLLMLVGIAGLIVFLGLKGKKEAGETAQFYQRHSLISVTAIPAKIFEALTTEKLYCRQGNLKAADAEEVMFYWCEWSRQSMISSGNSRQITNDYFFAAAFPPAAVSEKFMQKAIDFMTESRQGFAEKLKDFFVLNTQTPIRAEKLSDGSFLIGWRAKKLADDYEQAFSWLQNNLTLCQKEESLPEIEEELPLPTEIQRLPFLQFMEEMPAAEQVKSYDMLNVMDAQISEYHDTKGHPTMSAEEQAQYLELSLDAINAAQRAITEIEFSAAEYLAKGFLIPELLNYQGTLAYRLSFPSRTVVYLDRPQIFLDDSGPLKVYVR